MLFNQHLVTGKKSRSAPINLNCLSNLNLKTKIYFAMFFSQHVSELLLLLLKDETQIEKGFLFDDIHKITTG